MIDDEYGGIGGMRIGRGNLWNEVTVKVWVSMHYGYYFFFIQWLFQPIHGLASFSVP
jgi:hypothetical protein